MGTITPVSERQIRPLTTLEKQAQQEAWRIATSRTPSPTAQHAAGPLKGRDVTTLSLRWQTFPHIVRELTTRSSNSCVPHRSLLVAFVDQVPTERPQINKSS